MGCAQTKPITESPSRGLERLKLENGYVKGEYVASRRSTGQRVLDNGSRRFIWQEIENENENENENRNENNSIGIRGDQEEVIENYISGSGKVSQRMTSGIDSASNASQKSIFPNLCLDEEMVDGWPKWLSDNIPRKVLAGLVPRSADSYDKLDKVGQGTYSNVYKARDRKTGKIVALKKVKFDTSEPESVKFMAREIMILQRLDHPNIVKLEGLATSRMHYSIYLVFEYMQTDLARIISRPDERLNEPQVKSYMTQLLSGLQHCHERGILHRDIKGSNLLIDKDGMLKIADFGLANYFNPEKKRPLTSRVVTLWYRAPELLLGATEYGTAIDLWSVGCLMAEMFIGKPIMPGRTEVEQLHRIFKLCGTPSDECWKRLKAATTFRPPHAYKPRLREAFKDFPPSSVNLLDTLLSLDPSYRGSAGHALLNEWFYTSPSACDLSGLPIVYVEEDEPETIIERKKHRSKYRSQSKREGRKKSLDEEKQVEDHHGASSNNKEKEAEPIVLSQEPQRATISLSSSVKATKNEKGSKFKSSPRKEAHPNVVRSSENKPPLPYTNSKNSQYANREKGHHRLNHIQRSISTREFRDKDRRMFQDLH
ncbi:hypothetical protein Leryth_021549 [Lithospermum erythrorhizon]|nr:hypothetical protein Leryth_021549 [Lithospermum erythrorhizon]